MGKKFANSLFSPLSGPLASGYHNVIKKYYVMVVVNFYVLCVMECISED